MKRTNIIKPENLREYKKFVFYIVACFTICIISSIRYQDKSDKVKDYGVEWKTKTDVECIVLNSSENIGQDRTTRFLSVRYKDRIIKSIPINLATFEKAIVGETINIKLSKSDIYGEGDPGMKYSVVGGLISTIAAPILLIIFVLLVRENIKNIISKEEEDYLVRISKKYKISISDLPSNEKDEIRADYNWKHWLKIQLPLTVAVTSIIYYLIVCIIYWSVTFRYYFV